MNIVRVLQTSLWQSHPYLLCLDECWKHMFPILPPETDSVRVINMERVQCSHDILPVVFANSNTSQPVAFIVIRDGRLRLSAGNGSEQSVIVPPDHPQLSYFKSWVAEADSINELHERVLRWLAYMYRENKQPIRTIRKAWPSMANLLSKHKHIHNYADPADCYLDRPMMERYESIIAKGLLNPPIDLNRTVVHPSNFPSLFRSFV